MSRCFDGDHGRRFEAYLHGILSALEDIRELLTPKVAYIHVVGYTEETMANSAQTFPDTAPVTFKVTATMSDGSTKDITADSQLVFAVSSGDAGAFSGDVLTPTAGSSGVGSVTATYVDPVNSNTLVSIDDVTITAPALTVTDINVTGS